MAASSIVDTAETYGWDTVFAIHIADANAAIAKAGTSPKTFEATDEADGVSAKGEFGTWAIATGGSGELVRLSVPLASVQLDMMGEVSTVQGTALVDVRLDFLRQDDESGQGDGQLHHLKVSTTPSAGNCVASIDKITYTSAKPSFLGNSALIELLGDWLNANLGDFNHVFSTIDLNAKADQGEFQWIQPTDVAYAYADTGAPNDGVLGVLCMTEGRSSTGLIQQISSMAIPEGARAGFLVSKERVLSNLMLPGMPHVFSGSSASDYTVSTSGDSIVNVGHDVSFETTAKGKTYPAEVQTLNATIVATEFQLEVLTETNLSPGVKAYCRSQNFMTLHLVDRADGSGSQTLGYVNARPAEAHHWTTTDPGIQVTEEILGILAILLALIAIVVTDGAAIGLAAMVIGVVSGTMALTTDLITDAGKDNAPAIDAMVLSCTAPIVWNDAGDFKITVAGLSDSLQLGGDPNFAG